MNGIGKENGGRGRRAMRMIAEGKRLVRVFLLQLLYPITVGKD